MAKAKKILFTGGGTGGPTVPLIAVYQELIKDNPDWQYFWLGTHSGPEKNIVQKYNIKFRSITAAKFSRHFSLKLLLQPIYFLISIIQAAIYLIIWRPHIILSVGGYVSVPVVIVGKAIGIPSLIHQQDIKPGLANDIMSFYAKQVTVSVPELLTEYKKAKVVGNPVRQEVLNYKNKSKQELINNELKQLSINRDLPLVVVTGGGTGAEQINNLLIKSLPELSKFCQVVHLTGRNRGQLIEQANPEQFNNYKQFEFLSDDYLPLIAAADLVVSRAGMSALTELSVLGKPTIVIPMPNSHQEKNAEYFNDQNAIKLLNLKHNFSNNDIDNFITTVHGLIDNSNQREVLANNFSKLLPTNAAELIAKNVLLTMK